MSSNCDSDGCPIDHDGSKLEDFCGDSSAPIAVNADVFREIMTGSILNGAGDVRSHLEVDQFDGVPVINSSTGGIPVLEQVDIDDVSSDDKTISPTTARELCGSNISSTIQAMLRTTKHERDALHCTRKKLMDALEFLRKKGFSEENIYEDLPQERYFAKPLVRDEFGLPKILKKDSSAPRSTDSKVFEDLPHRKSEGVSGAKTDDGKEKQETPMEESPKQEATPLSKVGQERVNAPPRNWSSVLKSSPPLPNVKFDYCPPKAGTKLVDPPDEVLREGLEKFKFCIVGVFTKGSLSFSAVNEIANNLWSKRGLLKVSQKNDTTFVFKFASLQEKSMILARGVWHFNRRPLVLSDWGVDIKSCPPKNMPIWVKFKEIPDCYWTRDGLSRIASAVGQPLCADKLTSQLEILPFACLCVNYNIGDDLPSRIPVKVLDSAGQHSVVDIHVEYINKPLICSGCKALGHLVSACPTTQRIWVEKKPQVPPPEKMPKADVNSSGNDSDSGKQTNAHQANPPTVTPIVNNTVDQPWQAVPKRHSFASRSPGLTDTGCTSAPLDASPPIGDAFKNLRKVDELESSGSKLSRAQRKRLRKSLEKVPPPPPSSQ